jgi:hypothetical protein
VHGHDSESRGGNHHGAPKAVVVLEARMEDSFICSILVFDDDSCEPSDLFR